MPTASTKYHPLMPDTFIPPPALSTVKFLLVIFAVQAMLLYAVHRTSADRAVARRRVLYRRLSSSS